MYQRLFDLPMDKKDSLFLFGPRGTGKTAWLKQHLSGRAVYIDLLESDTYRRFKANPELIVQYIPSNFTDWIVIDEVQKVPELLDEVHRLIESKGYRFILTGSSARKLKRDGVNLLAGRAIRYTMHPLTVQELGDDFSLEHALTFGMLPATYTYDDPTGYLSTYVDSYLKEEVMQEGLTRNISAFNRFLEVASFSQGSVVNAAEIAREVGINRQAIQAYFSILEDLLLAHRLPAFTTRAKRRLITSDKFYYFDTGVYRHLRPSGVLDSPSEIAGACLETLFFQSALAVIAYMRLSYKLHYWRTSSGVEVDFICYGPDGLIAFEIKHSKTIQPKMLTGLKHFKEDYPIAKCYIIYMGTKKLHLADGITAMPFTQALEELPDLLSYPAANK